MTTLKQLCFGKYPVAKKKGYWDFDFYRQSIYHIYKRNVNTNYLADIDVEELLSYERKQIEKSFDLLKKGLKSNILAYERCDDILVASLCRRFPIFYLDKELGELLLKTSAPEKIPAQNFFASQGVILLPKDLLGGQISSIAFALNVNVVSNTKTFRVAYMGNIPAQRGCATVLCCDKESTINVSELYSSIHGDPPPSKDFSFEVSQILSNIFLYKQAYPNELNYVESFASGQGFSLQGKSGNIIKPRMIEPHPEFKVRTIRNHESTGTHASPQTHWRSGHWRQQLIGSREKPEHKTIWIEPVLVNA